MNLTVGELKKIIEVGNFPDDMPIVTTNHPEDNINAVSGFCFIRTVGMLNGPREEHQNVLCLAPTEYGIDMYTLVKNTTHCDTSVSCTRLYF